MTGASGGRATSYSCFKWGTGSSPGMTRPWARVRSTPEVLQWGHGEFAVDDVGTLYDALGIAPLQWGHGEFAVDDEPYSRCPRYTTGTLQWGHGEFAVDDPAPTDA